MNTRTVWEITWDGYLQDWLPKAVDGFGPFNRRRKSNKGATGGLCRVVSFLIAIIGTPWILIHYLAFNNHNVRPQSRANKIGYWIATIIALLIDGACIATALFIWATIVPSEDTALGIMSFTLIIPLLYAGFSKLHYLFIKSPYEPRVPTQYEEQEEVEYGECEEQEEVEQEEEEIVEELPFCQIFRLNETEDLHIVRVEYCPDETAFIRVVSEESYTKEYKRKVYRDRRKERYIMFNNERYYLDPIKTKARMPE